jgi:hypothetical protein
VSARVRVLGGRRGIGSWAGIANILLGSAVRSRQICRLLLGLARHGRPSPSSCDGRQKRKEKNLNAMLKLLNVTFVIGKRVRTAQRRRRRRAEDKERVLGFCEIVTS